MKNLITSILAMVFLLVTANLGLSQTGSNSLPQPHSKINKAPDPNLPKPGEKFPPKGKRGTVRKLSKTPKKLVPHLNPNKPIQK